MKYKQYQKYKDSGVEWIGEIPEEWEVKKLKFVANFDNSTIDRHVYDDEIPVSISHYPQVYNNETISLKTELPKGTCSQKEFENFRLKKDDVLITKDSETADDIGVPVYILDDFSGAVCGYHIAQISTDKNQLFGGFLFRFIQSSNVNAYFETEAHGVTRYGLGKDSISNLIIPLPPKPEQEKIYDFLQKETTNFDDIISKSQSQINFLQEKRQALINHAVTKGLDPTIPMKDSGVEWIGKIPEHWEVTRYKFVCSRIDVGIAEGATHAYVYKNGIPIIRSTNVKPNKINSDDIILIAEWFAEKNHSKYLLKNDIVTVRTGYPGISAVVPEELNMSQCFTLLCSRLLPRHNPFFFSYVLNSISSEEQFQLEGWGAAQINISVPILENLFVTKPPLEEENQIAEFLDKQTAQFDELIAKSKQQINFLQEKRQAIITSAVTGKIDVRNGVAA